MKLAETVQSCLYQDFAGRVHKPINVMTGPPFLETTETNLTLRSVSALCARPAPADALHRFEANPRIRAVVTTNYDNLLQSHSRAKYAMLTDWGFDSESLILRTIERPSAGSSIRKIEVYQVHGSIRYDKEIGDSSKHSPDLMTLTEQDFFDQFNQPTRLATYTFLHLLREHRARIHRLIDAG